MQVRAREDDLHAHHHRRIRDAPAVGVEHRRDRQQHVGAAQAPEVAAAAHQGVQDGRAVRIHHALAAPGGARRVAHGHRVALVVVDEGETVGVGSLQQRLVVVEALGHRRTREREHDHALETVPVGELPVQRQQHVVDHEEAVVGVGGDETQFVGCQAQVQRVHHAAGGRNAEVALQVRVVVPGQRGHALALLQAQPLKRRGQRAGAPVPLPVAVPHQRLVRPPRDDLVAGEDRARALQQMVERQRHVHHGGLHRGVSSVPAAAAGWRGMLATPGPAPPAGLPGGGRAAAANQTSTSTASPCSSISSRRAAASPLPISRVSDATVRSKPVSP